MEHICPDSFPLEKDASTVSPLGYKKAASRVMPLLLPYLEQAAGHLSIVATEQTWTSDRNILEVGKLEDVQCQELTVVGYAYLGTDMSHRGGSDDDAAPKLILKFLCSTVNQRYQALAIVL